MKTTLRKLASEINFEDKKIQSYVDWEELARIFDISDLDWSEDKRLQAYHMRTWYCTDSYVGWRAYFLDGELVAFSSQMGRKFDEDFEFISKESALKVRDYLHSLVQESEQFDRFSIVTGLDEEIDDTYKIDFNSQILQSKALLDGEEVEIIKERYDYKDMHSVKIKNSAGKEKTVNCRELDFKYNTLD